MQDLQNAVTLQWKIAELLLQTQVSFAIVKIHALALVIAVRIFQILPAHHQNSTVNIKQLWINWLCNAIDSSSLLVF